MFIDPITLSMLAGTVLPLLVGIVTKKVAHPGLKAVLLIILSTATGFVAAATAAAGVVSNLVIRNTLSALVVGIATHYGVWKPTGVTETVQTKTEGFGVG